jgi:hypothetical protein
LSNGPFITCVTKKMERKLVQIMEERKYSHAHLSKDKQNSCDQTQTFLHTLECLKDTGRSVGGTDILQECLL